MTSILSFLLSSLLLYGYWAIFAAVLLSAIIVPLPVSTVLLAAGAFASQGYFSFFLALLAAVSANMIGDCFDFFLAQRYGHEALDMLHVRVPKYFERLERFVGKYPGLAIFLTRFVGTIEPLTSLLCGFIGVKWRKFILYDFLGNLVSDGLIIYAGYFLGAHWQDFTGLFNITNYILIGVAIVIALWVIIWRNNRRARSIID